ncbi:acetate CoA-transferase subunit alpha [Thermovenabulum gondwanense]|uniref:Acetate CoA-transferase subunit alpha n=1 Tax=Thermovenabulum gondwanense TaxID=520767 RepID=A0A162M6K2_9FIRM|nr:acetate CoA-transferase subunit alpha [Thermovenabulum gondwanense]KYO64314.1 Acetate CoA-transferase subunit alpha [Thermovenabulum gondwanense]
MDKVINLEKAISLIKNGMTVMIGGFLGNGTPELLIDGIIERGVKDLTIIANDTAFPDKGIGRLIVNRRVKKVITSHIGTNPETGRQMTAKEIEVELVPQGTLVERIRAKGAGLGGFLTPTGVGTIVEEGKEKFKIDNKEYLLEKPLGADVALIRGYKTDRIGNTVYYKSMRNFNPIMAMAADLVILEADHIVEVGELDPDIIVTPGIFVDYIVGRG